MDMKIQVILSKLNPDLHDLILRVFRSIFSMLYETLSILVLVTFQL